ncbi:hypothetical protein [Mycolicibacterium hassiacum]|uniref:hypothetical protein n=1 Tax=Mycolicibacterium hassiacum TaxID=46351 RepID=UPI000F4D12C3|nr:hypothetical protein [Mycolicibacterium hassiacum]MDA4084653.1 hypothetical protein [Mycolicibacterium hassiacum DSM 44199]
MASGQITELFDQRVTFIELNSAGSELYSFRDQYGQYWVLDPVSGEVIRNHYPAVSGPTHAVSIEELSRPVDRGVSGDLRSGLLIAV